MPSPRRELGIPPFNDIRRNILRQITTFTELERRLSSLPEDIWEFSEEIANRYALGPEHGDFIDDLAIADTSQYSENVKEEELFLQRLCSKDFANACYVYQQLKDCQGDEIPACFGRLRTLPEYSTVNELAITLYEGLVLEYIDGPTYDQIPSPDLSRDRVSPLNSLLVQAERLVTRKVWNKDTELRNVKLSSHLPAERAKASALYRSWYTQIWDASVRGCQPSSAQFRENPTPQTSNLLTASETAKEEVKGVCKAPDSFRDPAGDNWRRVSSPRAVFIDLDSWAFDPPPKRMGLTISNFIFKWEALIYSRLNEHLDFSEFNAGRYIEVGPCDQAVRDDIMHTAVWHAAHVTDTYEEMQVHVCKGREVWKICLEELSHGLYREDWWMSVLRRLQYNLDSRNMVNHEDLLSKLPSLSPSSCSTFGRFETSEVVNWQWRLSTLAPCLIEVQS